MMTTGTRTDGIDASASAHDVCARLAEAAAGIRSAAPRFSVLIPCFNAEATLGETLSSLAAQRFTDFEAVVLDDGSSDGSAKIAADTASRDARFRLVRLENGGPSRARNIGAYLHAWADLIAFLDSDDLFVPEKLARMAERFDAADAPDAVYGRIAFFRGAPESARTISTILPQPLEARDLLRENPVCTMSNILTLRLYGEGRATARSFPAPAAMSASNSPMHRPIAARSSLPSTASPFPRASMRADWSRSRRWPPDCRC